MGALALLRQVDAVRSTPQVRFNIGLCEEQLGRLNAARGHYMQAAQDAAAAGAADVAAEARRRAAAVAARIPQVVIARAAAPGAVTALDGVQLGDAVLGQPMPVDPGKHEVVVTAPGRPAVRETVVVREGEVKRVGVGE